MPMHAKCKAHYDKIGAGRNMGRRNPTSATPGSKTQKRHKGLAEHKRKLSLSGGY